MTQLEFLLDQKARCVKWLDTLQSELPGTLTHEKAGALLEQTEDELLDHLRYQPVSNKWSYADSAA